MNKIKRPLDWPANQRERRIEAIYEMTKLFLKEPTNQNKDKLSSMATPVDVNDLNNNGLARITDYEVKLMNSLYLLSAASNLIEVRFYLYWHIYTAVLALRMIPMIVPTNENKDLFLPFMHLLPDLQLFFVTYYNFRNEKNREFIDAIVNEVNEALKNISTHEQIEQLAQSLISMVYGLSFMPDKQGFPVIAFTRADIKKLFSLCALLLKKAHLSVNERPVRGTMNLAISNWIMNSRNGYNSSKLYKYMSQETFCASTDNKEIWMRKTVALNDKREGKLFHELLMNKTWMKHEWAKTAKVTWRKQDDTFITSFSKSAPTLELKKKYGDVFLGYKNDRVSNLISPIYKISESGIFVETVRHYDVLYGFDAAKEELDFLLEIVDLFNLSGEEKARYLGQLMRYWEYSFKDTKWKGEQERRYEITISDVKEAVNLRMDDLFLKIKTPIFLTPDFVSPDIQKKELLRQHIISRIKEMRSTGTLLCEDCLNNERINYIRTQEKCPQCGSYNLTNLRDI